MAINKLHSWLSRLDTPTITLMVKMVDEEGSPSDEHLELHLEVTQNIIDSVTKAMKVRDEQRKQIV